MSDDVSALTGAAVVDGAGDRIGTVAEVYLDDRTSRPQWVTVRTGLLGRRETFVPLAAARFDGDLLVVDATKEQVAGAPEVPADGHISRQDEDDIYRYYGLSGDAGAAGQTARVGDAGYAGPGGRVGADDAMTRSEEHLVAGTREVAETRARLRKYVVTETVTVEVPVRREEVRLEHEPIPEAAAGGTVQDVTDATDVERDMILHAERPVVTTETVPVERVRLGKEVVTGTETVTGEVRKEKIELDDPTGTANELP